MPLRSDKDAIDDGENQRICEQELETPAYEHTLRGGHCASLQCDKRNIHAAADSQPQEKQRTRHQHRDSSCFPDGLSHGDAMSIPFLSIIFCSLAHIPPPKWFWRARRLRTHLLCAESARM